MGVSICWVHTYRIAARDRNRTTKAALDAPRSARTPTFTRVLVILKRSPQNPRIGDVSNGEINRDLQHLKRIFSLAMQAEKILRKRHVPLLEERNTRTGFFEMDALRGVLAHLPAPLRPVITFAYVTGWRITSEVLPLVWRQVDFTARRSG